jgi:signal transduction histidine kinase
LLRIAQIESGSRKKGFQPVQLSEVVERVARAYQPVAEDASKELTTVIEPDLHIIGDRDLLTQMLANLVENSIRHTPAQTRISVRARSERNAIIVEVADSGTGIPAAERERVFERFYRLDASRRTPGNGLGLSLVAAVAALHDAETELQDNSPGLLVVLKLPLPGPTAASAVSSLRQSGGMERVVRVSDL